MITRTHFGHLWSVSPLQLALEFPRVPLNLRPSVARANLFSDD